MMTLFSGETMSILMFSTVIAILFILTYFYFSMVSDTFKVQYKALIKDQRTLSLIYLYINAWWYYQNRLRFLHLVSIAWTLRRYLNKLNTVKSRLVLDETISINLVKRIIDYNTQLYINSVLKNIKNTRKGLKPVRYALREMSFFSITTSY